MAEIWKKHDVLSQLGGDETFLKELIGDLKDLIDQSLNGISGALETGDHLKAAGFTHTLKGSSGNLGAMAIYQTSKELEAECRASGSREKELFLALESACQSFLTEVKSQGYL